MGGCAIEDDHEYLPSANLTLVLVGKTGNGKSATGNSILGSKEFVSKLKSGGVTVTSELKTTKLEDGQVLNVIDTPGLFDSTADSEFIGKEIVGCVNMARNGIHGVLAVFSVLNRFSKEEKAVLSCLETLFGSKIFDYVTIVFTGGDALEEDEKSLDEFLCDSPPALKEILRLCGNRYVLFDNKTKDQTKKVQQLQQLLSYVKGVLEKNGGEPYTNEIFAELKKQHMELKEQMRGLNAIRQFTDLEMLERIEQLRDKQIERIVSLYVSKIEKLLEEERAERMKAEENAKEQQKKFEDDINMLKEELEKAKKATGWCVII